MKKKIYYRIRSQWPTSYLSALFCLNANSLWNIEQNLVRFNQNDLQMELFQIYVTFYTKWPSKMAASASTKNSENIKQTISHELPNGFCQNMCHTDAFIEFLMWRHKAGPT